jgi:hypothetical protein
MQRASRAVDALRSYRVMLDGEEVGRIRDGERATYEVASGRHELFLKLDWCRSPALAIDLGQEEKALLECEPSGSLATGWFFAFFQRHRYITLRRLPGDGEPSPA